MTQRIMDLAKHRKISHVLTYKLDRTFRNTVEGLQAVQLLAKKRVALHVVEKQSVVRTDSADEQFMTTLDLALASRERKLVSERTKAALARKRELGEFTGGQAPYGYRELTTLTSPHKSLWRGNWVGGDKPRTA